MTCGKNTDNMIEELLAFSSGKLSPEDARCFQQHVVSCEDCAALARAQFALLNVMDAWQAVPVSSDFDRRLYDRIAAEEASPWLQRMARAAADWMRPVFARPAVPLAAATFALVMGFAIDHAARLPNLHASPRTPAVEVEQVEATLDDIEMLHQFDTPSDVESSAKSL